MGRGGAHGRAREAAGARAPQVEASALAESVDVVAGAAVTFLPIATRAHRKCEAGEFSPMQVQDVVRITLENRIERYRLLALAVAGVAKRMREREERIALMGDSSVGSYKRCSGYWTAEPVAA